MPVTGNWDSKDKDERVDYELDWGPEMAGMGDDIIVASVWSVNLPELEIGTGSFVPTFTDTVTKVWLTGGEEGIRYEVTNVITTEGGRILEATVPLRIKEH